MGTRRYKSFIVALSGDNVLHSFCLPLYLTLHCNTSFLYFFVFLLHPTLLQLPIFSTVVWIRIFFPRKCDLLHHFSSALKFSLWSINKSFLRILGNLEMGGRGVPPPFTFPSISISLFISAMRRNGRMIYICLFANNVEWTKRKKMTNISINHHVVKKSYLSPCTEVEIIQISPSQHEKSTFLHVHNKTNKQTK